MTVLVAVASRHHSTYDIAAAIADELRLSGVTVDLAGVDEVHDIARYDAVILGSAVYIGAWLPEAWTFARRFGPQLAGIPVWLFSSGPLGHDDPKPQGDPTKLAELMEITQARGHRIFSGKLDQADLNFSERLVTRLVRPPAGDFRDWPAIRDWAGEIGLALQVEPARF